MTLNLTKLRAETLVLIHGTTQGPWREGQDGNSRVYGPDGMGALSGLVASFCRRADTRLVTAAPTLAADTLRLLDEIETRDAEIERLKAELAKANNEFGSETPAWPDLWKRTADLKEISNDRWREIERLRAENNKLRDDMSGGSFYQEDDIDAMQNEIERLRAVLERIETASRHWADYEAAPDAVHYAHESTARLARAALAEGGPDDH